MLAMSSETAVAGRLPSGTAFVSSWYIHHQLDARHSYQLQALSPTRPRQTGSVICGESLYHMSIARSPAPLFYLPWERPFHPPPTLLRPIVGLISSFHPPSFFHPSMILARTFLYLLSYSTRCLPSFCTPSPTCYRPIRRRSSS
jgi:hypothetical protein